MLVRAVLDDEDVRNDVLDLKDRLADEAVRFLWARGYERRLVEDRLREMAKTLIRLEPRTYGRDELRAMPERPNRKRRKEDR